LPARLGSEYSFWEEIGREATSWITRHASRSVRLEVVVELLRVYVLRATHRYRRRRLHKLHPSKLPPKCPEQTRLAHEQCRDMAGGSRLGSDRSLDQQGNRIPVITHEDLADLETVKYALDVLKEGRMDVAGFLEALCWGKSTGYRRSNPEVCQNKPNAQ